MAVFSPRESLACRPWPTASMYEVDTCHPGRMRFRPTISETKWSSMDLRSAVASCMSWGMFTSTLLTKV